MMLRLIKMGLLSLFIFPVYASSDPELDSLIMEHVEEKILPWLDRPIVIHAIKQQNNANQSLTPLDLEKMDTVWRKEVKRKDQRPVIDQMMGRALSKFLLKIQNESAGLYTEIFVMDNKGVNVGQSAVTSDLIQSDEKKFINTFMKGSKEVFIDEVEYDDSAKQYQVQVSLTISDPVNKKPIGAITFGVDVERLQLFNL